MAEYIEREAVLAHLRKSLSVCYTEFDDGDFRKGCVAAIEDDIANVNHIPTADVVPKSEVETEFEKRLAKYQNKEKCIYTYDGEIWDYCVQGPCPHHKVLEEVRQEVARKIFEEIEQHRDKIHGIVLLLPEELAELKKKYIEGE